MRLRCVDRMSVCVVVDVDGGKTVGELKSEVCRKIGKDVSQVVLRRGPVELAETVCVEDYELRDGECIEIGYR